MEDSIEVILQDYVGVRSMKRPHPIVSACLGAVLTGLYGVWSLFALPGFRRIPWRLKVPYLPSSKDQTLNIMKLLEGRAGLLADLGSGDGRVVFAASSAGFKCTGFEINSILVAYAMRKARWQEVPCDRVTFVKEDFWKMEVLGEKLLKELPDDARVISCRFPVPNWPQQSSVGSGLDQTFAYDIHYVRSYLRKVPNTAL
ncbi:adenine nucleotide translocase lysine N-methyltransferase isoform X2 [Antennarius striatus]|uniref:adenine nucleotide translocase lysine N-methyltransferase isoform X2 n=1 Tax=Antennarius striatus TaxID=241820 RepID=UPI0035B1621A